MPGAGLGGAQIDNPNMNKICNATHTRGERADCRRGLLCRVCSFFDSVLILSTELNLHRDAAANKTNALPYLASVLLLLLLGEELLPDHLQLENQFGQLPVLLHVVVAGERLLDRSRGLDIAANITNITF